LVAKPGSQKLNAWEASVSPGTFAPPRTFARIVEAWPALPEHIRKAILILIG
jgi:hypothetical protein